MFIWAYLLPFNKVMWAKKLTVWRHTLLIRLSLDVYLAFCTKREQVIQSFDNWTASLNITSDKLKCCLRRAYQVQIFPRNSYNAQQNLCARYTMNILRDVTWLPKGVEFRAVQDSSLTFAGRYLRCDIPFRNQCCLHRYSEVVKLYTDNRIHCLFSSS